MTYRMGEGQESYEVVRLVEVEEGLIADVHALRDQLGRKWAGRPINRIEVLEPEKA